MESLYLRWKDFFAVFLGDAKSCYMVCGLYIHDTEKHDATVIKSDALHLCLTILFGYKAAIRLELAIMLCSGTPVPVQQIVRVPADVLNQVLQATVTGMGWLATLFPETAEGVHSPASSGSLHAGVYWPIWLPENVMSDSQLGRVYTGCSAFEVLEIRSYCIFVNAIFADGQRKLEV